MNIKNYVAGLLFSVICAGVSFAGFIKTDDFIKELGELTENEKTFVILTRELNEYMLIAAKKEAAKYESDSTDKESIKAIVDAGKKGAHGSENFETFGKLTYGAIKKENRLAYDIVGDALVKARKGFLSLEAMKTVEGTIQILEKESDNIDNALRKVFAKKNE